MAEINLLKNELKREGPLSGKAGLWSLYIVVGILVFEVLIFVGLSAYRGSLEKKVNAVKQQASDVEFQISNMDNERKVAISFQERLINLKILLDSQVYWSPLFNDLEENTLSQIFFRTLQVSETENKLAVTGIATNYTDLAKLIRGLENSPSVHGVSLTSSGINESDIAGYSFGLEIEFDPKVLERTSN